MENVNYHPNLQNLNQHQLWLLEHQVTAFWHGFGFSGGLLVPIESTRQIEMPEFKGGPVKQYIKVTTGFMLQQLDEYIKWLKDYEKTWLAPPDAHDKRTYPGGFGSFLEQEKAPHGSTRLPILQMISLLQDNKEVKPEKDFPGHFVKLIKATKNGLILSSDTGETVATIKSAHILDLLNAAHCSQQLTGEQSFEFHLADSGPKDEDNRQI